MMRQTTGKRIHLIGSIAFTLGFLITPQTSRAQTTSPGTDTSGTEMPAKTSSSGSLPLPRTEAVAAISENNHLMLLPWFNMGQASQGPWVPGYMKLTTPIGSTEGNMFSIKIKGYRYGSGKSFEIRCGGYAYSGAGLINSDCFTEGTSEPVGIGVENNKVIVTIGSGGGQWYYDHFTAEYSGWSAKDSNDFVWQFMYNATPPTTNTHNVIVNDSAGTITTTGNVGIGTASPYGKLSIVSPSIEALGVGYQGSNSNRLLFGAEFNGGTGSEANVGFIGYGPVAGGGYPRSIALSAYSGSSWNEIMRLHSGGNVGIGTTSPQGLLHIHAGTDRNLRIKTDSGCENTTGMCIQSFNDALNSNMPLSIAGSSIALMEGNVGIGTTSPGAKLEVNGAIKLSAVGYMIGASTYGFRFNSYNDAYNNAVLYDSSGLALGRNFSATDPGAGNMIVQGNVGIGTPTPGYKLDVNGNTNVQGNITASGSIAAKYQDVAEWVPASEQLSAGTVVVLDSTKSNQVTSSSVSYDTRVAGVISEQPGLALGEKGEGKVLVATTGRVRVKVDASKGPIHIGDLLVTSDVTGMAMKSEPIMIGGRKIHSPGTLIGKALEPLDKGTGTILVLLSLQ